MSDEEFKVVISNNFQMGTWEYRVVRRKVERAQGFFIYNYSICEVHYGASGKLWMITGGESVSGEDLAWLRNVWMDMLEAFRKPVLVEDVDFTEASMEVEREKTLGKPELYDAIDEAVDAGTVPADDLLKKIGMTVEEFKEGIGISADEPDNDFDAGEYYRGRLVESDKQEADFKKYHGKRLGEIFDMMVDDRLKEIEEEDKEDEVSGES